MMKDDNMMSVSYHIQSDREDMSDFTSIKESLYGKVNIFIGYLDIYCTRDQALQLAEIIRVGVESLPPYDPERDEAMLAKIPF